jgi:hypothetical protein
MSQQPAKRKKVPPAFCRLLGTNAFGSGLSKVTRTHELPSHLVLVHRLRRRPPPGPLCRPPAKVFQPVAHKVTSNIFARVAV